MNEGELNMWLSNYQYFPKVFVLPSWEANCENDAERGQTFDQAESFNRIALEWRRRCGYRIFEVPMVSVDERCTFVLQALANMRRPPLIPLLPAHNCRRYFAETQPIRERL